MAPLVIDLLRSFDEQNKFTGNNYGSWVTEFTMTFGEDQDFMDHIWGTSTPPADAAGLAKWQTQDQRARSAIYKTIKSNAIRAAHFKETTPLQSASGVWNSIKAEYQKDSRASRFELKKRLYNPVHNTSQPISAYIQDIVAAAESLSALGHTPAATDVVDSILMNLDPNFAIVRTLLTSQKEEPSLATIKKTLTDQEDTKSALSGGARADDSDTLLYARKKKKKKKGRSTRNASSDTDSDSEDHPEYDWLNSKKRDDVCYRCGLPNHQAARCIADMPQRIKKKVIEATKNRRDASAERAALVYETADDTTSDSSLSEFDDRVDKVYAVRNHPRPSSKEVRREARRLLARLQA